MARVGFLLDGTFDDDAFQHALNRVREAGHEVVLVGPKVGDSIRGARGQVNATIERSVSRIGVDDLDAALLPAGYPRNHLRTHERALNFLRDLYGQGKPVAAMRQPGFAMARAFAGNRRASWPGVKRSLVVDPRGPPGEFEREEVIASDDADLDAFCDAFLGQLAEGPRGTPQPAFNEGVQGDEVARAYAPEPAPPDCR